MNTDKPIFDYLAEFGLNDIEAKIYLFLLHKEPQSILAVARGVNLARTTIYDNAEKLIERGLVERVVKYKSQLLKAMPISYLETIVKQEKAKTEKLTRIYEELSMLLTHATNPQTATQVRYYHGEAGFKQMMFNSLAARDEHIGYSELGRIDVVGEKYLTNWMRQMIERGIKDRVIVADTKETMSHLQGLSEKELRKNYQSTRILPQKTLNITGDTTIYNNIFAVAWWKQGEVVGVEIENAELVKTQKSIFELLWKQAEPLSPVI